MSSGVGDNHGGWYLLRFKYIYIIYGLWLLGEYYALALTNQSLKAEKFSMLLLSFVSGGREGSSNRDFQVHILESNTAFHALYYVVVLKIFSNFCFECILPCYPLLLNFQVSLSLSSLSCSHPGDFYRKLLLQPKTVLEVGDRWGVSYWFGSNYYMVLPQHQSRLRGVYTLCLSIKPTDQDVIYEIQVF